MYNNKTNNIANSSSVTKKELELLEQLKEASKPANFFSLKLEYNNSVVVAKKDFPADKYSPESIDNSQIYYIIVDAVKKIQEELKKNQSKIDDKNKAEQMNNLWKQTETKTS
jgi:hypothetical protein